MADDALGLVGGLGIERAHFVGLSKGGMVGQALGARHGDRLISLTLCSTACHMAPKDLWDARVRTAREQGMGALVDAVVERWFTPAFRNSSDPAIRRVREIVQRRGLETFRAATAAIDLQTYIFDEDDAGRQEADPSPMRGDVQRPPERAKLR